MVWKFTRKSLAQPQFMYKYVLRIYTVHVQQVYCTCTYFTIAPVSSGSDKDHTFHPLNACSVYPGDKPLKDSHRDEDWPRVMGWTGLC